MKRVIIKEENGELHAFWVKDDAVDAKYGIPCDPPDLNKLDWDDMRMQIHNQLLERNITTWQDVQREQTAITSIVQSVVKNAIVNLYKLTDTEVRNAKHNSTGTHTE